jgi:hypothetical protein
MEVPNRSEVEKRLARVVSRGMRAELDKLLGLLGDPPDLTNVPADYWQNGWRGLQKEVEPVLLDIYLNQAEVLMHDMGVGVDWALANTTAANWARRYTYDLVSGLSTNTRNGIEVLQRQIASFYEDGLNLGELRSRLEPYFGPTRAGVIAVTETTRSASEGERALVEQLKEESGIAMIPIWQTANDEKVCETCGPKDNKEIVDGVFPPEHPNCRCWVVYRFPKRK